MRNKKRLFAISLSALMTFSALALAGCGKEEDDGAVPLYRSEYVESDLGTTIVYDNYKSGYIDESDTKYQLVMKEGKTAEIEVSATITKMKNPTGYDNGKTSIASTIETVDSERVAHWDADTKTLTAVSEGTVTLTLKSSSGNVLETVSVDVSPAYVEDPQNTYTMESQDWSQSGALMGGTHDPSLIEVEEEDGKKAYYMFSTGWAKGNEMRKSYDLIHWKYVGKTMSGNGDDLKDINNWLYNGDTSKANSASWWAPDIVPAYGGGYWLYTCVVDGTDAGIDFDGTKYTTACIALFYSETLEAESFKYKGVLMQSCIPKENGLLDVNSIDPQITYTEDGRMFMAYGSFGTGNYILELNPKTGLRKDSVYKDGKFYDWKQVRKYSDEAVDLYNNYKNPDEDEDDIGWSTTYYGKNISKGAMEAPVIARHENVNIYDENGTVTSTKTYYYSMHSYDALATNYAMWGGRSEDITGTYRSARSGFIYNDGNGKRIGNQYMSAFEWLDWTEGDVVDGQTIKNFYIPMLTGHNDLFTTDNGKNIAAYIARSPETFKNWGYDITTGAFLVQTHQYYLNSQGNICINPNRYAGETSRKVSEEELLNYTKNNRFKMVQLTGAGGATITKSVSVKLNADHTLTGANGTIEGTWKMFGDNFIKVEITTGTVKGKYYGVVTPSWLDDQNCFGFSISALGTISYKSSVSERGSAYAMFMNAVSTESDK